MGKFENLPKVGDRVKIVASDVVSHWNMHWANEVGARLSNGDLVYVSKVTPHYLDGQAGLTIAATPGGAGPRWTIDRFAPVDTATLTIEAGKFYKTRDGRKVGPAFVGGSTATFGEPDAYSTAVWTDNGRQSKRSDLTSETANDIIAEWVDEPIAQPAEASSDNGVKVGDKVRAPVDDIDITEGHVYDVLEVYEDGDVRVKDDMGDNWTIVAGDFETVAPDVANDNAEPAKPKFKVGDRVKSIENGPTEGRIGTIIVDDGSSVPFLIRFDSWTGGHGDNDDEWWLMAGETETVATTPAIVALIENGTAKPATRPKVHADQESATTEAERLALQFPGQQFGVFVLADSKIADLVNVPTAVLRAA